jgi:hypothetical protein
MINPHFLKKERTKEKFPLTPIFPQKPPNLPLLFRAFRPTKIPKGDNRGKMIVFLFKNIYI